MEVSVSRVSTVLLDLKVSLPKEQVRTAISKAYIELGRNAQIRGFRRGKVPPKLLRQFFGQKVAIEVSEQLVQDSLPKALESQKIDPIAPPTLKDIVPLDENNDWHYTAAVEVRPEIAEIKLDGISVTRLVHTFDDHDVEHQIDHLRDDHATLRTPEPPRAAQTTDLVTLDYDVTIDGAVREDLQTRARSVEVGRGKLLTELEAAIPGMSIGDQKDVTVTFAADHTREDLRGKTATLKVTIKDIRERVLPELDDEFAKDLGHDDLAALKVKVRADMESHGRETSARKLHDDLIDQLVEKNAVDVPPSLVENAVRSVAREMIQLLRMGGTDTKVEDLQKMAHEQAEKRIRAGLLLGALAEKNKLNVTDADIEAKLGEMAAQGGKNIAKLRADYRDGDKRRGLANSILEDKVMTLLVSKVTITDAPAPKHNHEHEHDHG